MPNSLAIDAHDNSWIANCGDGCPSPAGAGNITELDPTGNAVSPAAGFSPGGLTYSTGIALDSTARVWVANGFSNSLDTLDASGQLQTGPAGSTTSALWSRSPVLCVVVANGTVTAVVLFATRCGGSVRNSNTASLLFGRECFLSPKMYC